MKYLIDSADVKAIEHISKFYPIAGVTTNPSLVAKEKTEFLPLIKKIRSIIGNEAALHIQATAKTAEGIGVTMTAIFTSQQALIAARAGADFVAPYVNRLDNINADGVGTVAEIVSLFDMYDIDCQVLAASFKNIKQIADIALSGAHCATIAPELFKQAISHPMTDNAIAGFDRDWKAVYGEQGVGNLLL